jgi:hypothetical protein
MATVSTALPFSLLAGLNRLLMARLWSLQDAGGVFRGLSSRPSQDQGARVADLEVTRHAPPPMVREQHTMLQLADSRRLGVATQGKLRQSQTTLEQWQAALQSLIPSRPGQPLDAAALGEALLSPPCCCGCPPANPAGHPRACCCSEAMPFAAPATHVRVPSL